MYQEENLATGAYQQENLATGAYQQENLATGAYQQENLATGTYKEENLATGAYQEENVATGMYQEENLATGAYQQENLATGAYQQENLATGAYQEENVATGTYQEENLSTGAYQQENSATGAYQQENLATGAYQQENLATGAYQHANLATGAYQEENLATGANQQENLATEAYQLANLATEAYQQENLATGAYQQENLATGTYQEENLAIGAYQQENLATGAYQQENLATGTYQEENLATGTYQEENLATGTYQQENLATGAYQKENLATGAYQHANLATGAYQENLAARDYLQENSATGAYQQEHIATGAYQQENLAARAYQEDLTASDYQENLAYRDYQQEHIATGAYQENLANRDYEQENLAIRDYQQKILDTGTYQENLATEANQQGTTSTNTLDIHLITQLEQSDEVSRQAKLDPSGKKQTDQSTVDNILDDDRNLASEKLFAKLVEIQSPETRPGIDIQQSVPENIDFVGQKPTGPIVNRIESDNLRSHQSEHDKLPMHENVGSKQIETKSLGTKQPGLRGLNNELEELESLDKNQAHENLVSEHPKNQTVEANLEDQRYSENSLIVPETSISLDNIDLEEFSRRDLKPMSDSSVFTDISRVSTLLDTPETSDTNTDESKKEENVWNEDTLLYHWDSSHTYSDKQVNSSSEVLPETQDQSLEALPRLALAQARYGLMPTGAATLKFTAATSTPDNESDLVKDMESKDSTSVIPSLQNKPETSRVENLTFTPHESNMTETEPIEKDESVLLSSTNVGSIRKESTKESRMRLAYSSSPIDIPIPVSDANTFRLAENLVQTVLARARDIVFQTSLEENKAHLTINDTVDADREDAPNIDSEHSLTHDIPHPLLTPQHHLGSDITIIATNYDSPTCHIHDEKPLSVTSAGSNARVQDRTSDYGTFLENLQPTVHLVQSSQSENAIDLENNSTLLETLRPTEEHLQSNLSDYNIDQYLQNNTTLLENMQPTEELIQSSLINNTIELYNKGILQENISLDGFKNSDILSLSDAERIIQSPVDTDSDIHPYVEPGSYRQTLVDYVSVRQSQGNVECLDDNQKQENLREKQSLDVVARSVKKDKLDSVNSDSQIGFDHLELFQPDHNTGNGKDEQLQGQQTLADDKTLQVSDSTDQQILDTINTVIQSRDNQKERFDKDRQQSDFRIDDGERPEEYQDHDQPNKVTDQQTESEDYKRLGQVLVTQKHTAEERSQNQEQEYDSYKQQLQTTIINNKDQKEDYDQQNPDLETHKQNELDLLIKERNKDMYNQEGLDTTHKENIDLHKQEDIGGQIKGGSENKELEGESQAKHRDIVNIETKEAVDQLKMSDGKDEQHSFVWQYPDYDLSTPGYDLSTPGYDLSTSAYDLSTPDYVRQAQESQSEYVKTCHEDMEPCPEKNENTLSSQLVSGAIDHIQMGNYGQDGETAVQGGQGAAGYNEERQFFSQDYLIKQESLHPLHTKQRQAEQKEIKLDHDVPRTGQHNFETDSIQDLVYTLPIDDASIAQTTVDYSTLGFKISTAQAKDTAAQGTAKHVSILSHEQWNDGSNDQNSLVFETDQSNIPIDTFDCSDSPSGQNKQVCELTPEMTLYEDNKENYTVNSTDQENRNSEKWNGNSLQDFTSNQMYNARILDPCYSLHDSIYNFNSPSTEHIIGIEINTPQNMSSNSNTVFNTQMGGVHNKWNRENVQRIDTVDVTQVSSLTHPQPASSSTDQTALSSDSHTIVHRSVVVKSSHSNQMSGSPHVWRIKRARHDSIPSPVPQSEDTEPTESLKAAAVNATLEAQQLAEVSSERSDNLRLLSLATDFGSTLHSEDANGEIQTSVDPWYSGSHCVNPWESKSVYMFGNGAPLSKKKFKMKPRMKQEYEMEEDEHKFQLIFERKKIVKNNDANTSTGRQHDSSNHDIVTDHQLEDLHADVNSGSLKSDDSFEDSLVFPLMGLTSTISWDEAETELPKIILTTEMDDQHVLHGDANDADRLSREVAMSVLDDDDLGHGISGNGLLQEHQETSRDNGFSSIIDTSKAASFVLFMLLNSADS
uniref:Uncharacterized protein n=1 Tax=Biomphalaria glabrata TaxID=6526 RepID=A0A2C9LCY7_BIOGL